MSTILLEALCGSHQIIGEKLYFSFPALLPTCRVKLNYELSWAVLSHLVKRDYSLHSLTFMGKGKHPRDWAQSFSLVNIKRELQIKFNATCNHPYSFPKLPGIPLCDANLDATGDMAEIFSLCDKLW